jgi:hypothetical protein
MANKSDESDEINKTIDIQGNGVFLTYQILFLLVSSLIGLGITVSVWNSYQHDIINNTEAIKKLEKTVYDKYTILEARIEKRHDETVSIINERYLIIEDRAEKNNERYKDWLKSLSTDVDKNKEDILMLKYSKINKK